MEITLTQKHLAELGVLLGEIPYKHAAQVFGFLNRIASEQKIAAPKKPDKKVKADAQRS